MEETLRKSLSSTESATNSKLGINVIDSEAGARICLSGRLSMDSSPDFRDRLRAMLDRQPRPALTVDLAELTYMDCSGISTLVESFPRSRMTARLLCSSLDCATGRVTYSRQPACSISSKRTVARNLLVF